jgi:hypothetical protein
VETGRGESSNERYNFLKEPNIKSYTIQQCNKTTVTQAYKDTAVPLSTLMKYTDLEFINFWRFEK